VRDILPDVECVLQHATILNGDGLLRWFCWAAERAVEEVNRVIINPDDFHGYANAFATVFL
jgi:hypothetical protein